MHRSHRVQRLDARGHHPGIDDVLAERNAHRLFKATRLTASNLKHPLIVVGVSTFVVVDPDGPFSKFTTLPAQIYQWTSRPQQEFQHLAAAAILVLLVLLIMLNAFAIWLRNRYSRRTY